MWRCEPGAQVFVGLAARQVVAQQALDGFGHERRGAAIADRAGDGSVLADRSAKAEVIGVGQLALVLDLLAFHADVGDPVLAAAVGAAGDVEAKLLIELRQALFEFVDKPAGKALGLGDGELAEFGARAGDGAAPEGRAFDLQTNLAEFARRVRSALRLGTLMKMRFCETVARSSPLPKRSASSAAASSCSPVRRPRRTEAPT